MLRETSAQTVLLSSVLGILMVLLTQAIGHGPLLFAICCILVLWLGLQVPSDAPRCESRHTTLEKSRQK